MLRLLLLLAVALSLDPVCGAILPSLTHSRVKLHGAATSGRRGIPQGSALTRQSPVAKQELPPLQEGIAVPFVSIDPTNQTLQLHPAALEALGRVPAPVCVLGMSGTARDGKSTWLNMYAQWLRTRWETNVGAATRDFDVGHDLDTCTTGGWMQIFTGSDREPLLPGTHCATVVLLDTQGLAKGHKDGLHRLFTLSLLMSSSVVLNVMVRTASATPCLPLD